jgi:hypothetical protein
MTMSLFFLHGTFSPFVFILHQSNPKNTELVMVLDHSFKEQQNIGKFDQKFDKYSMLGYNYLTTQKNRLYFIEHYNPKLNIYDIDKKEISQITVPNDNTSLDSTWNKKQFIEDDRKKLSNEVHRFLSVHGMGNGVYLLEMCINKNIFYSRVFNIDKRTITTFPYSALLGSGNEKQALYFNHIIGSFDKGIIAVFNDSLTFNKYKKNYLKLENIQFKADDNPIIVFFEFNQ